MDGIRFELGLEEETNDLREFSELHNELIFYLEDKILNGLATSEELKLYENYKYFDELDIDCEVCQNLIKEMETVYQSGFYWR